MAIRTDSLEIRNFYTRRLLKLEWNSSFKYREKLSILITKPLELVLKIYIYIYTFLEFKIYGKPPTNKRVLYYFIIMISLLT